MNTTTSILNWFEAAKPKPTIEDLCVQIGCHLEEQSEFLLALGLNGTAQELALRAKWYKQKEPNALNDLKRLLSNYCRLVALLDATGDQHVTGWGILKFIKELGFTTDDEGILAEINESNWSKFDDEGNPYFDVNGKIKKGPDYFEPDLIQFINK